MGNTFLHGKGGGGSAGLNFKVVGGITEPSSPSENTIWVNTDTKITSWLFSATEPELSSEGVTWIITGTSTTVEFNAVKKNSIQVYPVSVKQYINGTWVDKTAKSYQDGAWNDWWNGELYADGNEFVPITGGWVGTPKGFSVDVTAADMPDITRGAKSMTMHMPTVTGGMVHTANKIELTGYSTLVFDGIINFTGYAESLCNFRVWSDIGPYSTSNVVASKSIPRDVNGEIVLDISGLPGGEYYVGFGLWTDMAVVTMRSLYMR